MAAGKLVLAQRRPRPGGWCNNMSTAAARVRKNTGLRSPEPSTTYSQRPAATAFTCPTTIPARAHTEEEERDYLREVSRRIHEEEGAPPLGWSSPWLTQTENTLDLLPEVGYSYVMDVRPDDVPIPVRTRSAPLLAMPYALELNDSTSVIGRSVSPSDFAGMIIDEFDELVIAAADRPLVMSIVVHSFISGVPFRLKQLSRAWSTSSHTARRCGSPGHGTSSRR